MRLEIEVPGNVLSCFRFYNISDESYGGQNIEHCCLVAKRSQFESWLDEWPVCIWVGILWLLTQCKIMHIQVIWKIQIAPRYESEWCVCVPCDDLSIAYIVKIHKSIHAVHYMDVIVLLFVPLVVISTWRQPPAARTEGSKRLTTNINLSLHAAACHSQKAVQTRHQ